MEAKQVGRFFLLGLLKRILIDGGCRVNTMNSFTVHRIELYEHSK